MSYYPLQFSVSAGKATGCLQATEDKLLIHYTLICIQDALSFGATLPEQAKRLNRRTT